MRRKYYTKSEISSIPCQRCSKPSVEQWQVCSLDNKYCGICKECDILLNAKILKFMKVKGWLKIIIKYIKEKDD